MSAPTILALLEQVCERPDLCSVRVLGGDLLGLMPKPDTTAWTHAIVWSHDRAKCDELRREAEQRITTMAEVQSLAATIALGDGCRKRALGLLRRLTAALVELGAHRDDVRRVVLRRLHDPVRVAS